MSELAEYARRLHEQERRVYDRRLVPQRCGHAADTLKGIRAVIFDVYGTLVNYWRPGFESRERREALLTEAFSEIVERFGMKDVLSKMNPGGAAADTLKDFYHGLVALNYEKSLDKDVKHPEVRIDEVWAVIALMLKRNGYDAAAGAPGGADDLARRLAYTYNFLSMGRALYPGAADALQKLKADNIVLGIMADGQFYTPLDLTLLIREQSGGKIDDYNELFDADLTFFSYQYGFTKPSEVLYRRLFDALYEYNILPSQTLFVGNDLSTDIQPASMFGMKTALFCGDDVMVFGGDVDIDADIVPDIVFESWDELPELVSFYGET